MTDTLKKIIDLLGEDKSKLPVLFVLFLLSSIGDLVGIALIGPYIALIVGAESTVDTFKIIFELFNFPKSDIVVYLGLVLILVYSIKSIILILLNRYIFNFSSNRQAGLRAHLMSSCQSMSYEQFMEKNSSEYIHTIQQLTQDYVNTLRYALRSVSDSVVVILICLFLAWRSPITMLILVSLITSVIVVYDRYTRSRQHLYGVNVNTAMRKIIQGVNEGIVGFKEIRVLGKEKYFHKIVSDSSFDYSVNHSKSLLITTAPKYFLELLMVVFIVIIVTVANSSNSAFNHIIPTLAIFGVASVRILPAANIISSFIGMLRYHKDGINKLHDNYTMFNCYSGDSTLTVACSNEKEFHDIDFMNVSFIYKDKSHNVIDNVSFNIKSGEIVGFIGASGSGKTTIIDLMLGLLKPSEGNIKYNGVILEECLSAWWNKVAYIPQDILLLDDSLRSNIALGIDENNVENDKMIEALKSSRLFNFIDQLPEGIETTIGERGMRLSGGQKQRIALARALYHDREVLIFDEATSALDNETEKEIVDEIRYLKGNKTMIIIAHRLNTLQYCDVIYEIENGSIKKVHQYSDLDVS